MGCCAKKKPEDSIHNNNKKEQIEILNVREKPNEISEDPNGNID